MRIAVWTGGVLPLVLSLALAGCGGSSHTSSGPSAAGSSSAASSTASGLNAPAGGGDSSVKAKSAAGAPAPAKPPRDAVADVESTPIAKATFDHWLAVTAALSGQSASASNAALKDKVMGFLLTSEWVLGEAAALGIDVSEAAAQQHLATIQKKQFKQPAELQKYLARNHETMADLLLRVRLELLEAAISKKVTAGKRTAAEKKAALDSFQAQFEGKWKAKTSCAAGYVMEDCRN
jgi:hypothetical protein